MIGFIHERQVSVRSAIHSSRRAELPRGSDLQPKRAEPGASAPLGFACPTTPITFPDRHAVPSRAMRCRRVVRVTEPRGGSCSGGVRGWRGSQESAHCRSALLGCLTNVPLGRCLNGSGTLFFGYSGTDTLFSLKQESGLGEAQEVGAVLELEQGHPEVSACVMSAWSDGSDVSAGSVRARCLL